MPARFWIVAALAATIAKRLLGWYQLRGLTTDERATLEHLLTRGGLGLVVADVLLGTAVMGALLVLAVTS